MELKICLTCVFRSARSDHQSWVTVTDMVLLGKNVETLLKILTEILSFNDLINHLIDLRFAKYERYYYSIQDIRRLGAEQLESEGETQ